MNTLFDFLVILLILGLLTSAAALLASGLIALVDWMRRDDLHDVYARERAMDALAHMHPAGNGPTHLPATDRCQSCNRPVLVENTYAGICADCMSIARAEAHLLFRDWTGIQVSDDEWADLMRAIDDERNETEDHR